MIIPGLPKDVTGGLLFVYSVDAENVNPWIDAGNPTGAADLTVIVSSGVTIGSVAPGYPPEYLDPPTDLLPSMDLSTAPAGSRILLINHGRIQGVGGMGGLGAVGVVNTVGGGGGGGGGALDSLGGRADTIPIGTDDGLPGDNDAAVGEAGGLGGPGTGFSNNPSGYDGGDGQRGGTAILSGDTTTVIENHSEIWSGGGGGGGSGRLSAGGKGGDQGLAGDIGTGISGSLPGAGGLAGWAVNGSDISFRLGEFFPDVKGDVGEDP